MKVCAPKDFEKAGFNITEEFSIEVKNRLCPDIAMDDPHYIIKNLYSNKKERINMSVKIFKCNKNKYACKDDATIQEVF
jgi:hypothetical protein